MHTLSSATGMHGNKMAHFANSLQALSTVHAQKLIETFNACTSLTNSSTTAKKKEKEVQVVLIFTDASQCHCLKNKYHNKAEPKHNINKNS